MSAACPNAVDSKMPVMFSENTQKLHTSQALSMDIILSCGLELGSHAPECWEHVFRFVRTKSVMPVLSRIFNLLMPQKHRDSPDMIQYLL